MKGNIIGVLTGVVVLAGAAVLIQKGGQTSTVITNLSTSMSSLFKKVEPGQQQESGVTWLIAFAGLYLVLTIVADAGADELAEALAWAAAVTVVVTTTATGSLTQQIGALASGNDAGVVSKQDQGPNRPGAGSW